MFIKLLHGLQNGLQNGKINPPESGLVYHTKFLNLDTATYIDTPLYGLQGRWTKSGGPCSIRTITINGENYNSLYIDGTSFVLDNQDDFVNLDEDIVTFETTTYKDSFTGLGGGCGCTTNCPMYNCYNNDTSRGLGVMIWSNYSNITTYNTYRNTFERYFYSTNSNDRKVVQIATGGMTINKQTKEIKCYLNGKKCIKCKQTDLTYPKYRIYGDNMGGSYQMRYYVLEVKIYKGIDKFEMMT